MYLNQMHVKVASSHKIAYVLVHLEKMRKIYQKLLSLKCVLFSPFCLSFFLLCSSFVFFLSQEPGEKTGAIRRSRSADCHASIPSSTPQGPVLNDSQDVFGTLMGKFVGICLLARSNCNRVYQAGGEGNGKLPQYSCLENPMERGAWWVPVHGVAKSQTQLKRLSMHAHTTLESSAWFLCST